MSRFIGLLAHDFADQSIYRSNASLVFATAEDFGSMDVPSCQVSPGALTKVLVLDSYGAIRGHR